MRCWFGRFTAVSCALSLICVLCQTVPVRADEPGFGLLFDGSGDYVTMGPAAGLGTATFTLECWLNWDGAGQSVSTGGVTAIPLVAKGREESDGGWFDMNYFLGIDPDTGVLVVDFEDVADGGNHPLAGVTEIRPDIWHHAAATFDGTTLRLFLNGDLEDYASLVDEPCSHSLQHFAVGSTANSSGTMAGYFSGLIDEVRIWDYARMQAEIETGIEQEIVSADGLLGRWGFNEGSGNTACDSSGAGYDGTIFGASFDEGAPFTISAGPNTPTLVSPADEGTSSGTAELVVNVSDPDGDPVDVTFYGAQSNDADPFTIVVLPDTQHYSESYPELFQAQTQWIVDNRDALNIQYVAHVGDIVQNADELGEWDNADDAISILDTLPDLPYGLCAGNHDQDPAADPDGTENFNAYFPYSRYEGVVSWYGGHYGTDNDNHYCLFSAGGLDFIAIHFEFDTSPPADVLDWADQLLDQYADRRAMVFVHYLVGTGEPASFGSQGSAIYEALRHHSNLFFMHGGHICGEGLRTDTYAENTVYSILADYQCRDQGGNSWLRYYEFRPAENRIVMRTFSPYLEYYEVDPDSMRVLSYDMSLTRFEQLATVEDVPSGSDVSCLWQDLEPDARYAWYAVAHNAMGAATSDTWSFSPEICQLNGDLNCDCVVNLEDLAMLLGNYGTTAGANYFDGDFNGDGAVDLADLAELLMRYGGECD